MSSHSPNIILLQGSRESSNTPCGNWPRNTKQIHLKFTTLNFFSTLPIPKIKMKFGVVTHAVGHHMSFEKTLETIKAIGFDSADNGSECRGCQCSGHEQKSIS